MSGSRARASWVIWLSFAIAFVFTSLPLPEWADRFRPDWVALVLIYWCMALPHRVSIGTAWFLGLLLDATKGALLGQHALALTVVSFLTVKTHRQIRVLSPWQQSGSVLLFLSINQLLVVWINGIIGHPPADWWYLSPILGGALLWPWVFIVLRDLRRRFQVG